MRRVLALMLVAWLAIVWALAAPYFEMRTFNKFSKTKATYWDAVFADLRVVPD